MLNNPTAQDFINAQERMNLDQILNRYARDVTFKYTVDSAVAFARLNTDHEVNQSRLSNIRLGAIFAVALCEEMQAIK